MIFVLKFYIMPMVNVYFFFLAISFAIKLPLKSFPSDM